MYLEVVEHSWSFYIKWFLREIGSIDYMDHKDGEVDMTNANYLIDEIGYMTKEYENDKPLKKYFIQIENQYFLKFCKSRR